MKALIKHFTKSDLALESMLHTKRSRQFLKLEKSVIFGILAKGDRLKNCWKAEILEMAESDKLHDKLGTDQDGTMEKLMRLLFVELLALWSPKLSVRNALEKPVFTATFVMPLRANGDRDVSESYME